MSLWGFENIPAQYIPKDRGNVFDALGGVAGSLVDAAGSYARRQQERELALKRMQQEQGQFDSRMGMDRDRMAAEERGRAANLAMNERHNAAQEANWSDERAQRKAAFDALQAEKAGARRAEPITESMDQWKDVVDQPEVMPEAAKWNAAADVYKSGGQMMGGSGYNIPKLEMPQQSPLFQKSIGPGELQKPGVVTPNIVPLTAGEYATERTPAMAGAAGQARDRMAADKERANAANKVSRSDWEAREYLKRGLDAEKTAAGAGNVKNPIEAVTLKNPKVSAEWSKATGEKKASSQNVAAKNMARFKLKQGRPLDSNDRKNLLRALVADGMSVDEAKEAARTGKF